MHRVGSWWITGVTVHIVNEFAEMGIKELLAQY